MDSRQSNCTLTVTPGEEPVGEDTAVPTEHNAQTNVLTTAVLVTPPKLRRATLHSLYAVLELRLPGLAPNRGGGLVAAVALVLMIAVVGAQGGIVESLNIFGRWRNGWYWPTWMLVVLGVYQFIQIGWVTYDQTLAENRELEARYAQELARGELLRGINEHNLAQELQRAMLDSILENQAAARETLPTPALSVAFRNAAKFVQWAVEDARTPSNGKDSTEVLAFADQAISAVLDAILAVVKEYDRTVRPSIVANANYSANIMLYRSLSETSDEERRVLSAQLRCAEPAVALDLLPGVFELRTEWSATTETATANDKRDSKLTGLVLPAVAWEIPPKLRALPGGPRAWQAGGDFLRYADVAELRNLVLADGSGSENVANAVAAHFARPELAHVKSFISTALVAAADDAPDGPTLDTRPPVGVVNINCSKIEILAENRHMAILAPYLRALLYPLAGLVSYRLRLEGGQVRIEPAVEVADNSEGSSSAGE